MNYYQMQLYMINKPASPVKVKFTGLNITGEESATNWLDLNHDSIKAIREFLDMVESELEG